ncbi:MAG: DUF1761 domain-containing protein [Proteobacteria bacterium]|nr:MAG: DUF1761 domain-containing protein [Pseudomonadota bacterium]
MGNAFMQINWLAILAATVATFILGGVWYGVVTPKFYTIALGRENLPPQKMTPLFILGPTVCNLIATITSAVLLRMLNIETIAGAVSFGLLIGVGYIISTCMMIAINPNFPRPFLYTALNAPNFLISNVMTCVILTVIQ